MKKLFVTLAFLCCVSANIYADPIDVIFEVIGKGDTANPLPKSPVNPPQATLDVNVLTITTAHPDYTLFLLDEDGVVVWQTVVPAATSTVTLPATLTGDYELRLYPDGTAYFFYGYIELTN